MPQLEHLVLHTAVVDDGDYAPLLALPALKSVRIDVEGRPTVKEIAEEIRAEGGGPGAGLLTVQRKGECDTIGYGGLTTQGNGPSEEPELAYELLRAAQGSWHATEADRAVVAWAGAAGYRCLWPAPGTGISRRAASWRSSDSAR
jgi:hypothetical protein